MSCFQPPIPDPNNMRDFVSYPSAGNERLHCTMKRTEDDPEVGGPCYTLYLEYLGGLVPILKGRRVSKLRPEFVIMDPRTDSKAGGPTPRGLGPCSWGYRTTPQRECLVLGCEPVRASVGHPPSCSSSKLLLRLMVL